MKSRRILLLSSFIGSGHRRAAEAVRDALREETQDVQVRLVNFFEFAHPGIARALADFYFRLLNSDPKIWNYLYDPQEGRGRIAGRQGLRGGIELIRMRSILEKAIDGEMERDLNRILRGVPEDIIGMREFLEMLGAGPEVSERIYEEGQDRLRFPYTLIEGKLRLLRSLGGYLLLRMESLIRDYRPQMTVSTQVLPSMFCAKLKEREGFSFPLIAIITDFGVHSYWIREAVDGFIVPNSEISRILLKKGISARIIHDYGIPIDKKFALARDRSKMRERLGLNPERFTVLFMGGGTGLLIDLRDAVMMCDRKNLPVQMLLVAGENEKLRKQMMGLQKETNIPLFVYGFVQNVDELMAASDLIVTKPGGLTLSEAMASGLPLVLLKLIPGQEENNLRFLLQKGAAIDAGSPKGIGRLLLGLYQNPQILDELRQRAKGLAHPDSAARIARFLLSHPSLTPP